MTDQDNTVQMSPLQQKALSLARAAFTGSTNWFDSSIRPQVESALRQFQGIHPAGSKYHSDAYRSRSRLFRPKTRATIRKNEAVAAEAFFSTNDVVTCQAEDEDNPYHRLSAELKQATLRYRLKKNIPWFLLCMGAYQDAQTVGVCISYQSWRYDAKKRMDNPEVRLVPVENFRIDPGASWIDPIGTSPYLIELIPMRVGEVRRRATTPDPATGMARWRKMSESQIMAAAQAYSDTTRQTREHGRTDSQEQRTEINDFSIVWVHRNIVDMDGEDMVFYTLGTTHLLSDPEPINRSWWHGRRPYVMGYCVVETHKVYPHGNAGITRDVQAEINEVANQRIDNVKFAMNKRYFAKRGAQVDVRSLVRNVPGSVTFMNNPDEDVKVQETNDVTGSAYQEQDRLNLDFDDVAGAFSPSSIATNRKLNETVGGMQLLNANTNQVGSYQLRAFVETWVKPVLRQLVLLEERYETDEMVMALAAKAAGISIQGEEGRRNLPYAVERLMALETAVDVNMANGSTDPNQQINAFMVAMNSLRNILADGVLEKYGLSVQEVIKEIFGKLGYRNGERFFDTQDQDPRLVAAKQTIQQLQDELSRKVSPELVAAQVRKIDAEIDALGGKLGETVAKAFQTNAAALFASVQSAQALAAVPTIAPVADQLAKAAGYVPPPGGGADPDLPQAAGPAPGLTQNSVRNIKTGIEFTPGGAVAGDTSPMTPASPAVGANQGMDTVRAD